MKGTPTSLGLGVVTRPGYAKTGKSLIPGVQTASHMRKRDFGAPPGYPIIKASNGGTRCAPMTESLQRKIVSLEQYARHAGTGHQDAGRILTTVGRLASQRLTTLIADTIERADNALFERAEKAESAFLQASYYDAMRALRSGCETLEQEFSGRIATAVCQGVPRATVLDDPATDTGAPELEFLAAESDQVEVRLAIQGMVSKLRSSCQQNLYALDKRLGLLMGDPALQRTQNPLAPEVI